MNRKKGIGFFCIIHLGIFMLMNIHHIAQAAPIALMTESTFNFGSAAEGTKIKHDFVLENHGTEPLVIEKISTG